ncbi:MAG: response regulator [Prochloraceae cyanobacterium]|nr:response regulator [Prochloraceae cyanobacterium]
MENTKERILVVDDEAAVRRILKTRLSMIGYDVVTASDGTEAIQAFRERNPDLIVLDVMMPQGDGYYVTQTLRKESDVPIIMLTALGDVADRITGLQFGADDYLIKPFSPKELEARINSILRRVKKNHRSVASNSGAIDIGGVLSIDTNKRRVTLRNKLLRLTGIEFDLLELLIAQSGQALSRGDILEAIWGYAPTRNSDLRVVDVHVSRLRAKIETDPRQPEFIITERGTGYLFRRIVDLSEAAGL